MQSGLVFADSSSPEGANSTESGCVCTRRSAASQADTRCYSSSVKNLGAIIGGTVGAVFACIILLPLFLYWRRKRRYSAVNDGQYQEHPTLRHHWGQDGPPDM